MSNCGIYGIISPSRWHWQYLPNVDKFSFVKKDDPTWDKLV